MQDNSYLGYNCVWVCFFFNFILEILIALLAFNTHKSEGVLWPVYKYKFSPLSPNLVELIKTQQHWSSSLIFQYMERYFYYTSNFCAASMLIPVWFL